jgi:two-component system, chemotaxis family, sensor kinase CheA
MNQDLHQQFVGDMLTESHEGLDRYDAAILLIEEGHATKDTLNDVFRVVHTLKGTAGCLGFHHIEKIAHAGENLLDALRSDQLTATPDIVAGLLKLSDALRQLLQVIEATGKDSAIPTILELAVHLQSLRNAPQVSVEVAAPLAEPAPTYVAAPAAIEPADAQGWGLFDEPAIIEPVASGTPAPSTASAAETASGPMSAPSAVAAATVRVDIGLLDKLMNLVGELVLTRNQLTQLAQARVLKPEAIAAISQRVNLVTTELQEGVMKTRLQPIGNIWSKFPRIVRDIAHELGKQVRLESVGTETELDRTIIEAIRDPLTHIIRNSVDHGIESPERRAAAGKHPEGHILMRAYHEGGQVNIEIIDDGAGIDRVRVRNKAVEKKLISAEEAAGLSERELTNLIFLPGFSTAEKVTNVSGRGVGMDVVRTNIEKIGGSVDLQSTPGQGTTLKIKIPLTLAIVPALIVRAGGERFAIPQVSLLELVRIEGEAAVNAVENVYGSPVFRLRGNLLPLVFLDRELKLPSPPESTELAYNIIVLQADQRPFGLVVDSVCDTEEIVVKPIGKHLKGLPMFAGATIMGDGRVALILDALGLAQHARVLGEAADRTRSLHNANTTSADDQVERTQLLLFSLSGRERLALPLDQAARLEEFPLSKIELSGGREAVQYRNSIMPLVRLAKHLGGASAPATSDGPIQVIVYQQGGRFVGLVVERIHDIIEHHLEIQPGSAGPGILGSAVVQGRILDLVDIEGILRSAGFQLARAA